MILPETKHGTERRQRPVHGGEPPNFTKFIYAFLQAVVTQCPIKDDAYENASNEDYLRGMCTFNLKDDTFKSFVDERLMVTQLTEADVALVTGRSHSVPAKKMSGKSGWMAFVRYIRTPTVSKLYRLLVKLKDIRNIILNDKTNEYTKQIKLDTINNVIFEVIMVTEIIRDLNHSYGKFVLSENGLKKMQAILTDIKCGSYY